MIDHVLWFLPYEHAVFIYIFFNIYVLINLYMSRLILLKSKLKPKYAVLYLKKGKEKKRTRSYGIDLAQKGNVDEGLETWRMKRRKCSLECLR